MYNYYKYGLLSHVSYQNTLQPEWTLIGMSHMSTLTAWNPQMNLSSISTPLYRYEIHIVESPTLQIQSKNYEARVPFTVD